MNIRNPQQLAKYGESAYVRGFFQPDHPDHLIVSADWSAIELVLIGEFSGDPEFANAYGQRPHADLHSSAAAGVMGLSLDEFKALPNKKEMRTKLGKGANFEYWYSGWLAQVAKAMGWDMDTTGRAVEGYREQFDVAERWRLNVIEDMKRNGHVQLPDGQRRYRYEATHEWAQEFKDKWACYNDHTLEVFADHMIKRIQRRCGNQAVNAMIQGSCATMAKRTIGAVLKRLEGTKLKARFMLLIHDELLFSVHKDDALEFMDLLYEEMINGRGVVNKLAVDSSLAIGRTFQPWGLDVSHGQIELMEMQHGLPCVPQERWGGRASQAERQAIVDYLMTVEL